MGSLDIGREFDAAAGQGLMKNLNFATLSMLGKKSPQKILSNEMLVKNVDEYHGAIRKKSS